MRRNIFHAVTSLSLVISLFLVLAGCPNVWDEDSGSDTVTLLALDNFVRTPVRSNQPDTGPIDTAQYTGTIAWQTNSGAAHTGTFAASTVYRAVVTLTPKDGFTFTGVGENRFTYAGATVTNAANSGTVTITFPSTGAPDPFSVTIVSGITGGSVNATPTGGPAGTSVIVVPLK